MRWLGVRRRSRVNTDGATDWREIIEETLDDANSRRDGMLGVSDMLEESGHLAAADLWHRSARYDEKRQIESLIKETLARLAQEDREAAFDIDAHRREQQRYMRSVPADGDILENARRLARQLMRS